MRRFSTRLRVLLVASLVGLAGTLPAVDSPEKAAQAAAQSWLALVDAGRYAESWAAAAAAFRKEVTRDEWVEAVSKARAPLGTAGERTLRLAQHETTLPGAPPGDYVVIQYAVTFSKTGAAVETVTPMKEPDGSWRVSGYYVRPAK